MSAIGRRGRRKQRHRVIRKSIVSYVGSPNSSRSRRRRGTMASAGRTPESLACPRLRARPRYLEECLATRRAPRKKTSGREGAGRATGLEGARAGNMPYSSFASHACCDARDRSSWIEKARGRNYRQVEQMLPVTRRGRADGRPDPALIEHGVTWKLDAATRALLRETRRPSRSSSVTRSTTQRLSTSLSTSDRHGSQLVSSPPT